MLRRFSTFSLDTANQSLLRGQTVIHLPPKAYAVLSYLIDHSDRIVSKEELLDAVWPGVFVHTAVLKNCVLEIRKALGENSKESGHIATLHRRGYRFVTSPGGNIEPARTFSEGQSVLLGREKDLYELVETFRKVAGGESQVVFITGEPGIGKSSLVSHFLTQCGSTAPYQLLQGQCVEHYGTPEPYYSVFHALTRTARAQGIPKLVSVLREFAPTWLGQMPGILETGDFEKLKREIIGATRDRMIREMIEALRVLAAEQVLILVLEDLHWSDVSTLDLISSIASRMEDARVLLIGTYRPIDAVLGNHPVCALKRGLLANRRCKERALDPLDRQSVSALLRLRFPCHEIAPGFIELIHERTDGNPLFLGHVLEHAAASCLIEETNGKWRLNAEAQTRIEVPDSLSRMIEAQVERLTPEQQRILEMGSVIGTRFALALLPTGARGQELGALEMLHVEEQCDGLARREVLIRAAGILEMGPGRVSPVYQFTHQMLREVIYKRLSTSRRARFHADAGERLETAFGSSLREVASELALHFRECCDYERAIRYLRLSAQRSVQRQALAESLEILSGGLEMCKQLPEATRVKTELEVMEEIGLIYRLMGRLPEAVTQFERMFEAATQAGLAPAQLQSQLALASVASWIDRSRCLQAVDTALLLCNSEMDSFLRVDAKGQAAYFNLLFRGWDPKDRDAAAAALDASRCRKDCVKLPLHGNRQAFFLALSSRYREACETAEEGIRLAIGIESLVDYSVGQFYEAWALLHLGEWGKMLRLIDSAMDLASKNGHVFWNVLFGLLKAFLHVEALSFDSARQISEDCLARAYAIGHELSIQMGLVLLGRAELGLEKLASAERRFDELRRRQKEKRMLMDWIWQMPLQFGITELCLVRRDVPAARTEAVKFQLLTGKTAERTWTGLAHYERASVAVLEGDEGAARVEVLRGLECIEGYEAPLAEWRLRSLAGQLSLSREHDSLARAVVLKLGNSLDGEKQLRQTFLWSALEFRRPMWRTAAV